MVTRGLVNEVEWFEWWFESEHYLNLYSHRDRREALAFISFLRHELDLPHGARILDLGCGPGRHSVTFASEGFDVTGFDLSNRLLTAARTEMARAGVKMSLVRGDIRSLPFKSGFDLVLSIFTSWGYFHDDEENFSALTEAFSLRKSGGQFVLDVMNPEYLKSRLVSSGNIERNGVVYDISREISGNRVVKSIRFDSNNETYDFQESVRMYEPSEIISVLESSGATKISLFGDYSGGKFDGSSSQRLICIAS